MLTQSAPRTGPLRDGARGRVLVDRPVVVAPRVDGVIARASDAPAAMYSSVAAALRVDAAVLDVVLKQLPSGVLVVDRDGRVAYANDAARALGLADGEALRWTITRTLLTGDGVRGEALVLPAEGVTARRLSVDVVPARSAGGAHAAVITVADVTARTRAAEWEPLIESLMNL